MLRTIKRPRIAAASKKSRHLLLALLLLAPAALALVASGSVAQADSLPSGQRSFHESRLEPAYNAANAGQIGYLLTPDNAPVTQQPAAWAPLYIVVYPVGTTAATTFNCMHLPVENCPTHGGNVASFAQATMPSVYGAGVLGHDHVLDFPSGDDFNFAWEPVRVLFTSKAAADEHLITDDAILAAKARGDVKLFPAPLRTFNCAVVPEAIWDMATPMT
jgi:hypothetical protein